MAVFDMSHDRDQRWRLSCDPEPRPGPLVLL